MSRKGVIHNPQQRHHVVRAVQVAVSSLALIVAIYATHDRWPDLALTLYFLFAGPVVVAAYTWGREIAGIIILAVVSFFIPSMVGGAVGTGELVIKALELLASIVLFSSLAVIGERAGAHRRQRDRYRALDQIGERFSRELRVEELLEVILEQTVPLFEATGGEIVLVDDQLNRLEIAAAIGVSRDAQEYLNRRAFFETTYGLAQDANPSRRGRDGPRPTLADQVMRQNEPFLHNQLESDPRFLYCDGDTPLTRIRVNSVLAVPLRRNGHPFGLLSLFNKTNGVFDQSDVDLLTTIADKSAITLENARLYRMTDTNLAQRVEELSILNRIAHRLVSSLDLRETIRAILDALQTLFPLAQAEICLWDPVEQIMRTYAWSGEGDHPEGTKGRYRLDEGYSGWIARHRAPLWIPDTETRWDVRPKAQGSRSPIRSYVGYPLKVGEQLIGSLELVSDAPQDFSTSARSILEALCNQAAVAIQNARLYQERQQRLTEMVGLQQISQAISSVRDVHQVFGILSERIARSVRVEMCGVLLYEQRAAALVARPPFFGVPTDLIRQYRIPVQENGAMWDVWQTADYWYSNDVSTDPLADLAGLSDLATAIGVRSTMFVVLAAGGRRFGVIQVSNKQDNSPFDESDARLLSILAHQAAVVLENARLYETEQARRRTMEALQASATAMSSALDLTQVVRVAMERAAVTFSADGVALAVLDPMGQRPALVVRQGLAQAKAHNGRIAGDEIREYLTHCGAAPRRIELPASRHSRDLPLINPAGLEWTVIVPLVVGDTPLGILAFCGDENSRPFSDADLELVTLFANQAAVAIENARLYTQTDERLRRRLNELTALNKIGQELNATLDLERILNLVLKEAVQATSATHGNVNLIDWSTGVLQVRTIYGFPATDQAHQALSLEVGRGVIGRAAETAQPVIVDDVSADSGYVAVVPETRSELAVPILHRGIVVGVINLESPQVRGFTEAHLEFLEALAAQAAVAISNARQYEEQMERNELMRVRAEQLNRLFEIGQKMRTDRPLEEVLTEIAFAVQETVGFNVALISVHEGDKQRRVAAAGIPISDFERMRQVRQPWDILQRLFQPEFQISNSFYIPHERSEVTQHLDELQLDTGGGERQAGRWHPEDMLLVPLKATGDEVLGILSVGQPHTGEVPDRAAIEALEIFAAQAAIAVENAHLFQQTRRQLQEMSVINEIGYALSATVHLDELLEVLGRQVARLVPTESFYVALYDQDRDTITFPLYLRHHESLFVEPLSGGEGLAGRILKTRRPLLLSGATSPLLEDVAFSRRREAARSYLGVPMMLGETAIGVIAVQDFKRDQVFDAGHERALSTVAVQAAIAIENARLFEEVRSYRDELEQRVEERTQALEKERDRVETLYRISSELGTSLDLDRVLNRALTLVLQAVRAERSSVFMLDKQTDHLIHRAVLWSTYSTQERDERKSIPLGGRPTRFRRGEGLVGWIMQEKQPTIVGDVYRDPRWVETEEQERHHRSVLAVPLIVADEALGALFLYHSERDYFTPEHLRLVEAVAVQVASAINNAELYNYVFESAERLGQMIKTQRIETTKTEAILEGVGDGVMVTDETGAVIRFNAAAERILNTPREQVLGRSTVELLGLYGASGAAWAQAIESWRIAPPHAGEETLFSERLGFEDRIVSVLLSPVVMQEEFLGTVSLFRDITTEVELDRTKSEFVSTVSHELRTPMTSIKGYADLLVMGAAGLLNEEQQRFLSIIKTNADRLAMLVNDLLDIGRIDTQRVELNLQRHDLAQVVEIAVASLSGKTREKKQTLQMKIPADLPRVVADRDRLIQILTNLISNAQQYTPTGGRIVVAAQAVDDLEPAGESTMVRLDVIDNGIGIAPQDQKKIFERFFRSDHPMVQETTGTGLGLSITRSLIEMQGGRLWVESELDRGSKFSFTLPSVPSKEEQRLTENTVARDFQQAR